MHLCNNGLVLRTPALIVEPEFRSRLFAMVSACEEPGVAKPHKGAVSKWWLQLGKSSRSF